MKQWFNFKPIYNKDSVGFAVRILGIDFSIFTVHNTEDMDIVLRHSIREKTLIFVQLVFIAMFIGRADLLYDKIPAPSR